MVNKEYKALKRLYELLTSNTSQKLVDLTANLNQTKDVLLAQINTLNSMGLEVKVENHRVNLVNHIDPIKLALLQTELASQNIKKPLVYLFSSTSSNELAKNNKTPSIYLCDHQSQGRGRQAKCWLTPVGQSIAISISHKFSCGLAEISGLNIAIGVAIIKTAEQFGCHHLGLKWPNDVLGSKGKVAGILIEASGNKNDCFVVIGIGINWNIRQSLFNTIDRDCMNIDLSGVTRTAFITALIVNVEHIFKEFTQNKLTNIFTRWKKHDLYTNQNINIIQGGTVTQAKYIGIDKQGYLQIRTGTQIKTLASGEVSIRKVD